MTTPPAGVDFTPGGFEDPENGLIEFGEERAGRELAALLVPDEGTASLLHRFRTWPRYRSGTRRCLLERFPFSIVYREARERIEIVAVAHAKRKPGYWRKR